MAVETDWVRGNIHAIHANGACLQTDLVAFMLVLEDPTTARVLLKPPNWRPKGVFDVAAFTLTASGGETIVSFSTDRVISVDPSITVNLDFKLRFTTGTPPEGLLSGLITGLLSAEQKLRQLTALTHVRVVELEVPTIESTLIVPAPGRIVEL